MGRDLIILAEDGAQTNQDYVLIMQGLGYEVRAFKDGIDALAGIIKLTEDEKNRAVLVTDWAMPRLDGIKLTKAVRQGHPQIPVMMWTFKCQGDDIQTMIEAGAHYALVKTFEPVEVQEAIVTTVANFDKTQNANPGRGSISDRVIKQSPGWDRTTI